MRSFRIPKTLVLLLIIFLLGATVRFAGLGRNPVGIVDDEADTAYDAYSLIRTGKDQWGTPMPITSFRGFGDYRLPAYTYLSVPSIALFGLTPFAVRLPAALMGSLSILLVYFLAKAMFGRSSEALPLLSAFFLAVSPWHVGMSRIGLEETTSVFIVALGVLALLKGRERSGWIAAGSALLALSLYIYTPNILLAPFLLVAVLYLFRAQYRRLRRGIILGICAFILIALPMLLALGNSTASTRTRQVNFTNDSGTIDLVNEKQGACQSMLPRGVCRLVFNKYSAFKMKFVSNYLNHFSPNLLGIYGTNTQFSILPGRGLLYVGDYCLFIVGLIAVFANPTPGGMLLAAFLFFSAVPDSLTSDGQFGRFFVSYPVWPILSAFAVLLIARSLRRYRAVLPAVIVLFSLAFVAFIVEYWTFFPYRYSSYSHFGYEALMQEVQAYERSYGRVIVSSRVNDSKQYIYYLFYTAYDPARFQSGEGVRKVLEANGWVRVKRINSVEFPPALPGREQLEGERTLLIGAPSEFPETIPNVLPAIPVPIEFTIRDKAGNVLFVGVDSSKLYL